MTERRRFFPMSMTQQVPGGRAEMSARLAPVVKPTSAAVAGPEQPGGCGVESVTWVVPDLIRVSYEVVDYNDGSDPWAYNGEVVLEPTDVEGVYVADSPWRGTSVWHGRAEQASVDGKLLTRPAAGLSMVYARHDSAGATPYMAGGISAASCLEGASWRFRWLDPDSEHYLCSSTAHMMVYPLGAAGFIVLGGMSRSSDGLGPGQAWLTPWADLADPHAGAEVPVLLPPGVSELMLADPDERLVATLYCGDVPKFSLVLDVGAAGGGD